LAELFETEPVFSIADEKKNVTCGVKLRLSLLLQGLWEPPNHKTKSAGGRVRAFNQGGPANGGK
jgi:hypothetical protein